jgi:ribosomal protein L11 methyltransferase
MSWVRAAFELETSEPDAVADALLESGAFSVDIADADVGTLQERPLFGEPGAEHPLWPRQRFTALFDAQVDVAAMVGEVLRNLAVEATSPIRLEGVAEQDWVRATQQQFAPIKISERMWIVPSWCEPPDPAAINLRLDPGLAFGTGSHPTTRQCLSWLEANIEPGCSVLDYGCGSGILALAARMLGAGATVGVDIDPAAVAATIENARRNQADIEVMLPDRLPASRYRIVVANILSNPLKLLAPLLASHAQPGGSIVLAGILSSQAEEVVHCYAPWFGMRTWSELDGWICLTGSRTS